MLNGGYPGFWSRSAQPPHDPVQKMGTVQRLIGVPEMCSIDLVYDFSGCLTG